MRGRRLAVALGAAAAAGALAVSAAALGPPGRHTPKTTPEFAPPAATPVARGRQLFVDGCSACHGLDARGIDGRGPSLRGVGAEAADFYLSTGRMPLENLGRQPERAKPTYSRAEIDDLVAYVASLGGPPIPDVDPARGDIAEGTRLFQYYCMGCHQAAIEGGVAIGALPPTLRDVTPTQVGEAIRIGPWVMPRFSERQISDRQVDSVARYVLLMQHPVDRGGWGIGHVGPVAEGMVAFFIGLGSLLLLIRVIGKRSTE